MHAFRLGMDFGNSIGEFTIAAENKKLLSSMPETCSSRSVC